MSLSFSVPCRMSLSLMSPVDLRKADLGVLIVDKRCSCEALYYCRSAQVPMTATPVATAETALR